MPTALTLWFWHEVPQVSLVQTSRIWSSTCFALESLGSWSRALNRVIYSQAAIKASKDGGKDVSLKDFEWAKDRIIMGAERKSSYIDEKVKKLKIGRAHV